MPHHLWRPRRTATTLATALAAALVVPALLAGCSQAKEAGSAAADKAASKAGEAVQQQTKEQITKQLCVLVAKDGPLADGKISERERPAVVSIAGAAEQAGVPQEFTAPLRSLASSDTGAKATSAAIGELTKACAKAS